MHRWYVLKVKSGDEISAASKLQSVGYKVMLPLAELPIRSKGVWQTKLTVLLPGYLMVFAEYTAENYYRIKKCDSIQQFVGNGASSYLSPEEEEYIKLLSNESVIPSQIEKTDEGYKIVSGVLRHFTKDRITINARDKKAEIKLSLCGIEKKVTVGIEVITKTD